LEGLDPKVQLFFNAIGRQVAAYTFLEFFKIGFLWFVCLFVLGEGAWYKYQSQGIASLFTSGVWYLSFSCVLLFSLD
jgi:hypothetical protein